MTQETSPTSTCSAFGKPDTRPAKARCGTSWSRHRKTLEALAQAPGRSRRRPARWREKQREVFEAGPD